MIKWSTLLLLFVITNTNAQIGCNCQSQLMRLEVEGGALTNALTSSPKLQEALVPSLTALFASDVFKSKVVTDYPMLPMGFPASIITCNKEKADGDPKFKNIDCYDPLLCASSDISQEVKSEVCVALPCSLIMGSQGMGKCGSKTLARPTMVHFPQPVGVKKLEMKPLSVSTDDGVLKACFDISALEITAGVDVEFGKEPSLDLEYERMGLDNINVKIDGNREVCMSAKLDLSKPEPLSEISIEHKNGNFISDKMIAESMAGANVRGMSGYTPATLSILKLTAVPPLARNFRSRNYIPLDVRIFHAKVTVTTRFGREGEIDIEISTEFPDSKNYRATETPLKRETEPVFFSFCVVLDLRRCLHVTSHSFDFNIATTGGNRSSFRIPCRFTGSVFFLLVRALPFYTHSSSIKHFFEDFVELI